jgi:hypothetical protein
MRKDETMLASALSTLSDRFDAKFLIAYWLPPFVAALGGIGILAVLVGGGQLDAWVQNLDSVEQTLTVILFLLTVTMAAFVLRALSRPIIAAFAGEVLPDIVADWARRGQINAKRRAARSLPRPPPPSCSREVRGAARGSTRSTKPRPSQPALATCWRRRLSTRSWPTRWRASSGGRGCPKSFPRAFR